MRDNTYSWGSGAVPIPTSRKYPTAYIALASPASAALFAHRYASVSDCGSTPGEPTRYHAVRAKQASRWFCCAAIFWYRISTRQKWLTRDGEKDTRNNGWRGRSLGGNPVCHTRRNPLIDTLMGHNQVLMPVRAVRWRTLYPQRPRCKRLSHARETARGARVGILL